MKMYTGSRCIAALNHKLCSFSSGCRVPVDTGGLSSGIGVLAFGYWRLGTGVWVLAFGYWRLEEQKQTASSERHGCNSLGTGVWRNRSKLHHPNDTVAIRPDALHAFSGGITVRLMKPKVLGPLQGPARGPSNALEMSSNLTSSCMRET